MNVQLDRMESILSDLRANKKYMMERLAGVCRFVPSNDLQGDCGTTLAIQFDSEADARRFAAADGIGGTLPIDTGKHIYKHWTPIMKKRGALHPLMDPFKMEANKDIVPDYTEDMCPETLEKLAKAVYIIIDPDDDKAALDRKIETIQNAMAL